MSMAQARATHTKPTDHRRRGLLAKVHIAKKQLLLDEDDYRAILFEETGETSAGNCDQRQLEAVVRRLTALGFKPISKSRGAQHPMAKKARALWISLHQLGVVRNPDEKALEAFAKRQLGCERLAWAKQSHSGRLIEALKSMATKAGWAQSDESGNRLSVMQLQEGLCEAILTKLKVAGEVPDHWTIDTAAWRLCGINTAGETPFSVEDYSSLAGMLGKKLRVAAPEGETV